MTMRPCCVVSAQGRLRSCSRSGKKGTEGLGGSVLSSGRKGYRESSAVIEPESGEKPIPFGKGPYPGPVPASEISAPRLRRCPPVEVMVGPDVVVPETKNPKLPRELGGRGRPLSDLLFEGAE